MTKAYLYDSNGREVATGEVGETIYVSDPDAIITHVEYVGQDGQRYRAPVDGGVVQLDESETTL